MKLHRAARKYVDIPARFYDRFKRELPAVSIDVALLPAGTALTALTPWTTVPMVNRRATIYLVGPDAGGPAVGVTVPTFTVLPPGLDLYVRPTDTMESDPVYAERITLS
jgi:hypothetical protein